MPSAWALPLYRAHETHDMPRLPTANLPSPMRCLALVAPLLLHVGSCLCCASCCCLACKPHWQIVCWSLDGKVFPFSLLLYSKGVVPAQLGKDCHCLGIGKVYAQACALTCAKGQLVL